MSSIVHITKIRNVSTKTIKFEIFQRNIPNFNLLSLQHCNPKEQHNNLSIASTQDFTQGAQSGRGLYVL